MTEYITMTSNIIVLFIGNKAIAEIVKTKNREGS